MEGGRGHKRVSSGCGHKIKWMLYVAEATRGSEHIEVLKSNHSQGSEHRQSREMEEPSPARSRESREQGTLCDRCGIDQSMSTPHWSSKCRSPLDDNKFPFNRIYLKFLFLFLAATHTQLHLHLYYSPSLTAFPNLLLSLSLSFPPNYLSHFSMTAVVFTAVAWHLLQILFCFFVFIVFNDLSAIFRRRCWKFPFTVCHIFFRKFCDFNFILICA